MNGVLKNFRDPNTRKKSVASLAISIVILIEVIAIALFAVRAWVETVSSIKITNETNTKGVVDTYVFTEAEIGGSEGTIDLAKYFKQAGDMHLAPASSADGRTFFFPKANLSSSFIYRKGNVSDKNTTYMSVSFKLRADTNADFFFDQVPTFSALGDDIRVSVTSQSEGSTAAPVTKIYAKLDSTTAVVNSTGGATGATTVEKFEDHIKGKSSTARLFAVGAYETKIITINVWLQKKTNANTDLTANMSQAINITNFGITSSLTPRHVTLLPTPTWDNNNAHFYAWCWGATNGDASRLYKLELDDKEHYSFDYNGTYQNTLFIRTGNANLTKEYLENHWNDNTVWNKTEDTTIPDDIVDPTFIIETINGSSEDDDSNKDNISDWNSNPNNRPKKSTGSWHDPVIVHVDYVTNQTTSWGTLSATSYVGTATTSHVIEATNSSSQKHKDTVHAWPGKKLKLVATANTNSNYAFDGWYDNAEGTGNRISPSATYEPNAPSNAGGEITYYAKFKETRTFTLNRLVDGNASSTAAAGTLTVNGSTTGNTATSKSVTVDKGSSVTFSASAATGYTLSGIYTTSSGNTTASSPLTLNDNTNYYARFTTNSYNVTANAYYSTNGGSSYTAGSTGGTVKVGSANAGATSTESVKYKASVNMIATAESGYEFVGWYSAASGGTQLSTNTTYSYTMNATSAQNVYARFIRETWEIGHGTSGGSNWSYNSMSVSGNTVTGTLTLTEGQDFSFKIRKTVGSTSTYYGANNASYSDITSTSFISNLTLSASGNDIYMKGHAGTYTFEFNKSTNKLNVTASYSNITITFDYSSQLWWGNDNAVISFYDGSGESNMSNVANQTKKTLSISSTRGNSGNVGFNRWNNSSHSTHWNNENAGSRGYSTTYKLGSGWQ